MIDDHANAQSSESSVRLQMNQTGAIHHMKRDEQVACGGPSRSNGPVPGSISSTRLHPMPVSILRTQPFPELVLDNGFMRITPVCGIPGTKREQVRLVPRASAATIHGASHLRRRKMNLRTETFSAIIHSYVDPVRSSKRRSVLHWPPASPDDHVLNER